MDNITINLEDIETKDACNLIDELSEQLKIITGNDGRSSFSKNGIAAFAVARDMEGQPLGCGALREISRDVAEVKRMFVRKKHAGVGSKILLFLEDEAKRLNYTKIVIETRVINTNAVNFYKRNGYEVIENYGIYKDKPEAICFEKKIKDVEIYENWDYEALQG